MKNYKLNSGFLSAYLVLALTIGCVVFIIIDSFIHSTLPNLKVAKKLLVLVSLSYLFLCAFVKVNLTEKELLLYYPFRPFLNRFSYRLDSIYKIKFISGRGQAIKIFFKGGMIKKNGFLISSKSMWELLKQLEPEIKVEMKKLI